MRKLICILLTLAGGLGCARIYRPITLAPPPATAHEPGLSGRVVLQPWGDNSRYERKALRSSLRMLTLSLENGSDGDLEILRLEVPGGATLLPPGKAARLVKQQSLAHLLYPLLPGVIALGASDTSGYGPSDKAMFQGLAIVGFCVAVPNAVIAARSNRRLAGFFHDHAWAPGHLKAGEARQGLVFVRSADLYAPLPLGVVSRDAGGEQRLSLVAPGARPR